MYDLIRELRETKKRTEKVQILESIKGTDLESMFLKVSEATYSPYVDYYTKEYEFAEEHHGNITLTQAMERLQLLNDRLVSGNAAIELLEETDAELSAEDAEVFRLIVRRDLLCGAAPKTINKVWPNHIYIHPYMRAKSFNKKNLSNIQPPFISQTKEDGKYVDIICRGGEVDVMSRSGSYCNHYLTDCVKQKFSEYHNCVFQGEVLVLDENGEYLPRKAGNGHINSSPEEVHVDRLVFVLWDMIPLDEWESRKVTQDYEVHFESLTETISEMDHPRIRLIDSRICNSIEEAIEHVRENIRMGLEGTIIKNRNLRWKDGDSKDQVKVKVEFECELKIVEFKDGDPGSKYEGQLGSIRCVSADGILDTWCGGGLSDEERQTNPFQIDDIITVKSNDIINNETEEGKFALYLPRKTKHRKDKTEADTFERIQEQKEAFLNTLEAIGE